MDRVTKADGDIVHVWPSRDALVLKALAMVLAKVLPVSARCTHVKGHGGAKAAVRAVRANLDRNAFVMRTDVKSYYDSIDQQRMLEMLARYVKDRPVLNLLWQAMRRSVTWGGLYKDCERGISRGCPLSPLLGAFFLHELDQSMERSGLFYARFMDDILVLAPTRWKLRRAVRQVNTELARLDLAQHPDKTFIGRIEKGFDFLGYHFSRHGLAVAEKTLTSFVERLTRLYEQSRNAQDRARRLGNYVRRWVGWVRSGLDTLCFLAATESDSQKAKAEKREGCRFGDCRLRHSRFKRKIRVQARSASTTCRVRVHTSLNIVEHVAVPQIRRGSTGPGYEQGVHRAYSLSNLQYRYIEIELKDAQDRHQWIGIPSR